MLWKVYFWSFFCDPTSSDSTIWHRIHRMNFQPRHFDKNNKMLHFRARHDGIFEHKLLDILKNLLLNIIYLHSYSGPDLLGGRCGICRGLALYCATPITPRTRPFSIKALPFLNASRIGALCECGNVAQLIRFPLGDFVRGTQSENKNPAP